MNYENDFSSNLTPPAKDGIGYLVVRVTTAKYAIPLQGATVSIYDNEDNNRILYNLMTNSVGSTDRVEIPTVPASASQTPGNAKPFSTVNIEVSYSGYRPMQFISVPIFDTVLAVQRADMIPGFENGQNYIYDFRESEALEVPENNL